MMGCVLPPKKHVPCSPLFHTTAIPCPCALNSLECCDVPAAPPCSHSSCFPCTLPFISPHSSWRRSSARGRHRTAPGPPLLAIGSSSPLPSPRAPAAADWSVGSVPSAPPRRPLAHVCGTTSSRHGLRGAAAAADTECSRGPWPKGEFCRDRSPAPGDLRVPPCPWRTPGGGCSPGSAGVRAGGTPGPLQAPVGGVCVLGGVPELHTGTLRLSHKVCLGSIPCLRDWQGGSRVRDPLWCS